MHHACIPQPHYAASCTVASSQSLQLAAWHAALSPSPLAHSTQSSARHKPFLHPASGSTIPVHRTPVCAGLWPSGTKVSRPQRGTERAGAGRSTTEPKCDRRECLLAHITCRSVPCRRRGPVIIVKHPPCWPSSSCRHARARDLARIERVATGPARPGSLLVMCRCSARRSRVDGRRWQRTIGATQDMWLVEAAVDGGALNPPGTGRRPSILATASRGVRAPGRCRRSPIATTSMYPYYPSLSRP